MVGTGVGLVVKYILDKRYIFRFRARNATHDGQDGKWKAAQMGGLLLWPTIGALGAAQFGGIAFVFVFSAITAVIAAAGIALRVREEGVVRHVHPTPSPDRTEFPPDSPFLERRLAADLAADETTAPSRSMRLLNRGLIAANGNLVASE